MRQHKCILYHILSHQVAMATQLVQAGIRIRRESPVLASVFQHPLSRRGRNTNLQKVKLHHFLRFICPGRGPV